jgi:hypothetical protein
MKSERFAYARRLVAWGLLLCSGSAALAQDAEPRHIEVPDAFAGVPVLRAVKGGGDTFDPRRCNVTSSYTDANFSGGSFVLQAGFAEQEIAATSYVLQASDFPLKLDLFEIIIAQSGAVVSTRTEWSVLVWEGTPSTGTLIGTFSSNGIDLPYIEMPPGTQGVNLNFSVDPGDPEQIIINDNGSRTFSIGFRIDQHNNQTANPCLTAPPQSRNAFPTTDTSGLSNPSNNWLFGVNCGPFGCPANGGWARFSALASFCRPTGDWIMRTTWSSLNCTPGVGACCLPDGTCEILTTGDCGSRGGTYRGDGTTCDSANCPQPTGACCFGTGCLTLSEPDCTTAGGTWLGANTTCASGNTCPTGACCLPNGTCITGVTAGACAAQGGTFRGVGSSCAGANCPQPTGACCLSTGGCLVLTAANCAVIPGSSWAGALTTCADSNSNGRADVCEPACAVDFNQDGFVDFFDFDDYVACFEGSACPPGRSADFNNDGFVDFFDFDDFVLAFEAGC